MNLDLQDHNNDSQMIFTINYKNKIIYFNHIVIKFSVLCNVLLTKAVWLLTKVQSTTLSIFSSQISSSIFFFFFLKKKRGVEKKKIHSPTQCDMWH